MKFIIFLSFVIIVNTGNSNWKCEIFNVFAHWVKCLGGGGQNFRKQNIMTKLILLTLFVALQIFFRIKQLRLGSIVPQCPHAMDLSLWENTLKHDSRNTCIFWLPVVFCSPNRNVGTDLWHRIFHSIG